VPDLPTLAEMYLNPQLSFSQHWMVTRMMYGAQTDDMDYHKVGFDETLLAAFLSETGFCDIERVESFNLPFKDTSDMVYAGYMISLNVIARYCIQLQL
jgi:predicted SAM-dependent methyltransferase